MANDTNATTDIFLRGPLPRRAGRPLRGELEGLYSARRGEFRIIYEIDEDAQIVLIHRAQHRRRVYRR